MALFKYFTRQEKPTNSGSLLTKTEVEEADKAVAKILEPTSKPVHRGEESTIPTRLSRGVKLEGTQRKMVRQVLRSIFPQNGALI